MSRNAIGFMLVDAPHSALNNAGIDASERTENIVRIKSIRRGKKVYPYVSGQAFRYWWRQTLSEKFGWNLSPLEKVKGKSQVYTMADPLDFEDDDVFGYMRALKKETVTRLSPLKTSPLISVISTYPTQDFGVAARHEGDPVPYEHEFYSTVLKGIFSLNLNQVGVFYRVNKTGYKNVYEELEEKLKKDGAVEEDDKYIITKEKRIKRIGDVINALPYLFGGAKLATHLTDVTPKILILAVIDGGNHLFMNLVDEVDGEVKFNFEALKETVQEYGDILLTDIYIGKRKGFRDDWDPQFSDLTLQNLPKKIIFGPLNEITKKFAEHAMSLVQ
jgi:CRISPR-associated protein Cst2